MRQGLFISFEGIDGTGKTTQIHKLQNHLLSQNVKVKVTREPGGTIAAEAMREVILQQNDTTPLSQLFLINAARAEHVTKLIRPALADGTTILCDRFIDSTYIYQQALGMELIDALHRQATQALFPDLTIILFLEDIEVARARLQQRQVTNYLDQVDLKVLAQRNQQYQQLLQQYPQRQYLLIAADAEIETVHQNIITQLALCLN